MAIELKGNWKLGFAFDIHTLDSVYLGVDEFGYNRYESTRSEMGELIYRLKCKYDKSVINKIVVLLDQFKGLETFDMIIPIPSTNTKRPFQPVLEIANELGNKRNIQVRSDILIKRSESDELKNVVEPEKRKVLLKNSLFLNTQYDVVDKNLLLLDDLYRSGSTLSVATELLYNQGKAKNVHVLTMTKTRSKK